MAITNHERVGKAMDLLRQGLSPFVAREFQSLHKGQALLEAGRFMGEDRLNAKRPTAERDVLRSSGSGGSPGTTSSARRLGPPSGASFPSCVPQQVDRMSAAALH